MSVLMIHCITAFRCFYTQRRQSNTKQYANGRDELGSIHSYISGIVDYIKKIINSANEQNEIISERYDICIRWESISKRH